MGGGQNGVAGKLADVLLNDYGISIDGYTVNAPYSGAPWIENVLEEEKGKAVLIVAYERFETQHARQLLERYDSKIFDVLAYDFYGMLEGRGFEYEEILKKQEEYEELYCAMNDRKSKEVLLGFVNERISGELYYLDKLCDRNQYFDKDIIKFGEHEIFVDCGAYTGDTAQEFCRQIEEQNAEYDEVISFEPEKENFIKCQERGLKNHTCVQKGAFNQNKILYFHANASASVITENGEESIEVAPIDDIVKDKKVTMIKMDIEGSELAALHGAKNTICTHRPRLAICVYHKREDLLAISQYIKSLNPSYKLYLRTYYNSVGSMTTTQETVLYAV